MSLSAALCCYLQWVPLGFLLGSAALCRYLQWVPLGFLLGSCIFAAHLNGFLLGSCWVLRLCVASSSTQLLFGNLGSAAASMEVASLCFQLPLGFQSWSMLSPPLALLFRLEDVMVDLPTTQVLLISRQLRHLGWGGISGMVGGMVKGDPIQDTLWKRAVV